MGPFSMPIVSSRRGSLLHADFQWYKRLEAGHFSLSGSAPDQDSVEWDLPQLTLILEGIDLSDSRRRQRYCRPQTLVTSRE